MVSGSSPEWLPPGFTEKVRYKNGKKIKYYCNNTTGAKYNSKKDVIRCATAENNLFGEPQTTKGDDDKGVSSIEMVDTELDRTNDSSQWLPDGRIMEEKLQQDGSMKGSEYKVYIEPSSGNKFYSRTAVIQYLNTVDCSTTMTELNKLDNVDKFFQDTPQSVSKTNTGHISGRKGRVRTFKTVATEITIEAALPPGWIKEVQTSKFGPKVRKDAYYIDPASGYMFRSKRDALRYLETKDIGSCALRPQKRELNDLKLIMNEIHSSDPANERPSNHEGQLFPVEESSDVSGTQSFAESEAEILKQAQDVLDQAKITSVGANSHEENILREESCKNAEMESNLEQANEVSKMDLKTAGAAISSLVTDHVLTNRQLSENGTGKLADSAQTGTRKSKKRGNASLPLRTSKRLARSEPDIMPHFDLSERALRAAVRKSSGSEIFMSPVVKESASIPLQCDGNKVAMSPSVVQDSANIPLQRDGSKVFMSPPLLKESDGIPLQHDGSTVVESAPILKESDSTPLPPDIEPVKGEAERETTNKGTPRETGPLNIFEKLYSKEPAIPDDPASEKQLEDGKRSQESPFWFDFGESWSDPLEFAIKTLRGEISIEDTLRFTGLFNKPNEVIPDNKGNGSLKPSQPVPEVPPNVQNEFPLLSKSFEQCSTPYSQMDHIFKSAQPDAPVSFQNAFAPHTESFKKHDAVQQLPAYPPPFSAAPGNPIFPTFSGFNAQSSTDAGKKKDFPAK